MNVQKQEKGFTIIEVVLVLAIAALIFLMIFVALPALQRGQRDTARKNDANVVASALSTFRSNHRGQLPTESGGASDTNSFTSFKNKYLTEKLAQVPLEGVSTDEVPEKITNETNKDMIYVQLARNCSGGVSSRAAAVWVITEASNDTVCTEA